MTTRKRTPSPPSDDDEAVGYGKPPKEHRFKPGQSGNPRGRKKGAQSNKSIVQKVAMELHKANVEGMANRLSTVELAIMTIKLRAMAGDLRAGRYWDHLQEQYSARSVDMKGAYLIVPECLTNEEFKAMAREKNAKLEREIEASGASSFIEYLEMKRKKEEKA